jgi:hypothetical protein
VTGWCGIGPVGTGEGSVDGDAVTGDIVEGVIGGVEGPDLGVEGGEASVGGLG